MTGINIQTPWSELLINGDKSVETRSYPLPEKYMGEELALIETPGRYGRFKARIIGTITFSHSFKLLTSLLILLVFVVLMLMLIDMILAYYFNRVKL